MTWDGTDLNTYLNGGSQQTYNNVLVTGNLFASDELAIFDSVLTPAQVPGLWVGN